LHSGIWSRPRYVPTSSERR